MNKEKILHTISQGENDTVEFKQSFNKAVIETLVAFSNHRGGEILLGVDDKGTIKGIFTTEETVQKWINEIKQNTIPAILPIIDIIKVEGKELIVLTVNEFPIKPIAYKDRYFIRKQNSNHKLSVDEIAELRFVSLNYSFDAFEVSSSFKNLNSKAIDYFVERVKLKGRYNLSNNIEHDFIKLGIIKENGRLTRATELLFGNHRTNIHIGRFKSETTIIDDLMIRSPLILAVDEAMDFIKKNIRLGFEFGGETTKRTEKWQYPIPAIRELLLNAIVHRDYTNPTDVIVKIFDESIEITNPGILMGGLTVEALRSGNYVAKHRNKLITEAFYLSGDIEKYGTGFGRLKEWLLDYPNAVFTINDLKDFIQVTVRSSKDVTENVGENVRENVGENVGEKRLISILNIIKKNNKISAFDLSKIFSVTKRTIERDLEKLKNQNKIKRIGPDKGGHWEVK